MASKNVAKLDGAEVVGIVQKSDVKALQDAQYNIAACLGAVYTNLTQYPDVSEKVRMTSQAARSSQMETSGLMKQYMVTAAYIVSTIIPMINDAVEMEDADIITELFDQLIEDAGEKIKETKTTINRYEDLQSKINTDQGAIENKVSEIDVRKQQLELKKKSEENNLESIRANVEALRQDLSLYEIEIVNIRDKKQLVEHELNHSKKSQREMTSERDSTMTSHPTKGIERAGFANVRHQGMTAHTGKEQMTPQESPVTSQPDTEDGFEMVNATCKGSSREIQPNQGNSTWYNKVLAKVEAAGSWTKDKAIKFKDDFFRDQGKLEEERMQLNHTLGELIRRKAEMQNRRGQLQMKIVEMDSELKKIEREEKELIPISDEVQANLAKTGHHIAAVVDLLKKTECLWDDFIGTLKVLKKQIKPSTPLAETLGGNKEFNSYISTGDKIWTHLGSMFSDYAQHSDSLVTRWYIFLSGPSTHSPANLAIQH